MSQLKFSTDNRGKVVELVKGDPETAESVIDHIDRTVRTIVGRAFEGDAEAQKRLQSIHQICYPHFYELESPVQGAVSIRLRMAELSYVVMPVSGNSFLPPEDAPRDWPLIKLRMTPVVERIDGSKVTLTDEESYLRSSLLGRVVRHFSRRKSGKWTLQSLAFHDYLEELGVRWVDPTRQLRMLMRQAREYEREHPPKLYVELSSGELLPYYPFAAR